MLSQELHKMIKIEIVIEGEQLPFLQDLMSRAGVTGYTLIRDIAGMGHHGIHAGRLTYNDLGSYVMAIAVGPEAQIGTILDGLRPFFSDHRGVVFVSETAVLRAEYFQAA